MAEAESNIVEFTVSELSFALKRVVEGSFEQVRVRGEVGRVSKPGSGHIYLDLKDDKAVLAGVVWKGVAARLRFLPEQGLEVIATGKLTTFPGQSKYQIVIDHIEPAGAGALMALLEARRKQLAGEGLFDAERKKPLPYLPGVIGVVTSPSGAVIRDILHRLRDRFPVRVLIWPTRVQGEGAAEEIAIGIRGFNALAAGGPIPRPDVMIVARGGGSIEDLWAFNEEVTVRAVADSVIPVISAVGHETDWTLIDHAADLRAPTPTGAAEMAVPVRTELLAALADLDSRRQGTIARGLERRRRDLAALVRAMPALADLVAIPRQRLDNAAELLRLKLAGFVGLKRERFAATAARLSPSALRRASAQKHDRLRAQHARLVQAVSVRTRHARREAGHVSQRLRPDLLTRAMGRNRDRLAQAGRLLRSYSYQSVLERGFALVRGADGAMIRSAAAISTGDALSIRFADGDVGAVADGSDAGGSAQPSRRKTAGPKKLARPAKKSGNQGDLF
jgi:exodeoxyribonuclease VII large subunit